MNIGRFNEAAKKMVDNLFHAEAEGEYQEALNTTISVKVLVTTAAMLTALSELFGQSRYSFTGEILEDFTADLFVNLPEATRKEIAIKADKISTELLAKQGISCTRDDGVAGDTTWQTTNQFLPELTAHLKEKVMS